nr:dienelactone hydrolase family protein [Planctomycetota bacterium]
TYQYLVTLPAGYDAARAVPLVIFLHGKGNNSVAGVQEWGPPARVMKGDAFPFLLAAPICSDDWWQGEKLLTVVREIIAGFKVDRERVYLTGLSMGGFGSWDLGCRAPELFAAVVPICGGGDPSQAWRLQQIPVWAYHGAKDSVVAESNSARMVEALKLAGGKVDYTIYPEDDHVCWPRVYDDAGFYERLLSLRRPGVTAPDERARLSSLARTGATVWPELLYEQEWSPITWHLSNSTPMEASLAVQLGSGDDCVHGLAAFSQAVLPESRSDRVVPAKLRSIVDGKSVEATATVMVRADWVATYPGTSPPFVVAGGRWYELTRPSHCPAVDGVITVDGNLQEWTDAFTPCVPQAVMAGRTQAFEAADCSFAVSCRHDATHCYVAVRVVDDVIRSSPSAMPWAQDGVEVRFDARPFAIGDRPTDWDGVLPILASPADPASSRRSAGEAGAGSGAVASSVWEGAKIPPGVSFACVTVPHGYQIEIAVPSTWLDQHAKQPWSSVRINVAVNDQDADAPDPVTHAWWFDDWRSAPASSRSGTFIKR